jgi:putative ABC transport system permease protein
MAAFETLIQDLRYGVRGLGRAPAFTCAALLTLALGIGANTAIFSVVHAVLLEPLPYPEPDRIVQLVRRTPRSVDEGQTGRRYLFFRDQLKSVESLAAWRGPSGINLVHGDAAEFVRATPVSREFFEVIGVRPVLGSVFAAEHDRAGGPPAVILTHGLWTRRFGADPSIVGAAILLGGRSHVVIGIMPAGFAGLEPSDVFVPLQPSLTGPGGGFNYAVAGRLRPGATVAAANAEAEAAWRAFATEFPTAILRSELPSGFTPLQAQLASDVRASLLTLLGAVGLLLVIACVNTANLLLARASGRSREMALRAALGADRRRIVRQLLTESVLLALAGAVAGGALAYWAVPLLLALTPPALRLYREVELDATVLAATLSLAVVTGVLFGLAPALSLARVNLVDAFKDDGTRTVGSGRASLMRRGLVIAEVALCMTLLVGAGLLIRTFANMRAVDPGFDPAGVITARMSLQGDRYAAPDAYLRLFAQGLDRLRQIPGVQSADVVNGVPIERGLNLNADLLDVREADGRLRFEDALVDWRYASTGYFTTMGIPIVAGRGFEPRDSGGAPPVAVVNEEFARRFFSGASALGQRLRVFDSDGAVEIVGVAKDVREQGLTAALPALMYVPVEQANPAGVRAAHTYFQMNWVVRSAGNTAVVAREMREALRAVDPQLPISTFRTMGEVKAGAAAYQQFQMVLLTAFASIGLLLAAAGVYGVVASAAAQRTREFGIRLALGASRASILRSVLAHGVGLSLVGIAVGTGAAVVAVRTLQSAVWGISTLDPATFGLVAVVLLVVALLASLLPALRAFRVSPLTSLRQ